jgi:nucleoside-diphosphate-sugar epimerase
VALTTALLEASLAAGVRRFLFTSSSSVYSPDSPIPTPEEAPLRPVSLYGRSKRIAESIVEQYGQQGLATTIIRPAIVYGPGDRAFTPLALRLARLPLLPLVNGGRNRLDLVYVADVARLLSVAAQHPLAAGRVYNAGPGQPTSIVELVAAYRTLSGHGPRLVAIPIGMVNGTARLLRPLAGTFGPRAAAALSPEAIALLSLDFHLDMRRAAQELGFQPRYSLLDGLRETLSIRRNKTG